MPFVRTVTGDVAPERLGFTLPHEHTQCHLWRIPERFDYWELTADEDLIAAELERFRAVGGTCVVDVTLPGIGRDPSWLRRISARTGLLVVMGTGWYREPYYPPEALIDRRGVDELADVMIAEFHDGVAGSEDASGTRVRPGIIGEIGVHKSWVSAQEERVLRAAGRASRATGMAVTTHAVMSPVGLRQLSILEESGADPTRVVIGHSDSYPVLEGDDAVDPHCVVCKRSCGEPGEFLVLEAGAILHDDETRQNGGPDDLTKSHLFFEHQNGRRNDQHGDNRHNGGRDTGGGILDRDQ